MTLTEGSGRGHSEQSIPPSSETFGGGSLTAPTAAFILMGKTGVGKSSFIKLLGGRDVQNGGEPKVDSGIDSCTFEPTAYKATVGDTPIILLDTPGFDDSARENLELMHQIISQLYLLAIQKHQVPVYGVIFLHDISEIRFTGSQQKTLTILKKICGDRCMGNVIVGTTMWSQTGSVKFLEQEKREQAISIKHWGGIYKTTRLFRADKNAAIRIITDLLTKPPVLLLVQQEILRPPHTPECTTVGKYLIPEGLLELEQLRRERSTEEISILDTLLKKLGNPSELTVAEKLGLAVVAPIVLAPAAFISAPLGVVWALVHMAKKLGG